MDQIDYKGTMSLVNYQTYREGYISSQSRYSTYVGVGATIHHKDFPNRELIVTKTQIEKDGWHQRLICVGKDMQEQSYIAHVDRFDVVNWTMPNTPWPT